MAEWESGPAQPTLPRRKGEKEPVWRTDDVPAIYTSFSPHSADEEAEVQCHRDETENRLNRQTLHPNPHSAPEPTPLPGRDRKCWSSPLSTPLTTGLCPRTPLLRGVCEQPWENVGSQSTSKTSREAPLTGKRPPLEARRALVNTGMQMGN